MVIWKILILKAREIRICFFLALKNKTVFFVKSLEVNLHVLYNQIEGREQPQVMNISQSL